MHSNYVRSLFTIENGHGMRSSLSKECICEGRVRVCVFVCADVQYIYVCTAFKVEEHCKRKKETARVGVETHCSR